MTTLVLLHGAWHGGWSWAPLQAELERVGLGSVAMDLPSGEADAGAERYAEVVAQAVAGTDDDLVVVPHSLAGLVAPTVALRIGARGIVNLAALTPEPGSSGMKQAKALPDIYTEPYRTTPMTRHDDGSTSVPRDLADRFFYHDCTAEQADWAYPQLRAQFWTPWTEPCPLDAWPEGLRYAHVACDEDRVLPAPGMEDGARRTQAPLTFIPGGHLPMVSHPAHAADAIAEAIAGW